MRSASASKQDKTTNNVRVQTEVSTLYSNCAQKRGGGDKQRRGRTGSPACAYRGYRHECTLLANKLSKLKYLRSRWMPKLVLKHQEAFRSSQDKSSTRSSLDVSYIVGPRACAVFVNVAGSHMTFIACHHALLSYSTMLAYCHLGPFSLHQLNANYCSVGLYTVNTV